VTPEQHASIARELVEEIAALVPEFAADPIDFQMSGGNGATIVIDPSGGIHGRMFGTDRDKTRATFGNATRKAIQVRVTGYATGRFEELVFTGRLDPHPFGIQHPDFIGWEGGVPLLTADGELIAAAYSGFRGTTDVAIIERAAAKLGLKVKRD
jgi:glc operon protein GlcG